MKVKHTLFIIVTGFIICTVGILMKIIHLQYANIVLLISSIIKIIGILLFLYKLMKSTNFKSFLNS